jgi:Fe-S oxidoreductase
MSPIAMTLIIVLLVGAFAFSAVRRWRLLLVGAPEPRFTFDTLDALKKRLEITLVVAGAQKKMPNNDRYRLAGLSHIGIFAAFNVLLLNSVLLWVRGYDPEFDAWGILDTHAPIGALYSVAKELAAMGAIVGSLVFVYYRVVKRLPRMTLGAEGLFILWIIFSMMVADYVYVGADLVRDARAAGHAVHWHWAEPFGSALALVFDGLSGDAVTVLEHAGFWYHSTWVLLFLNLLPYSKHFHIITSGPNVFATSLEPKGKLPDVDDIEGKVEREEPIGVSRPEHLTWKYILDLYTCTECGRCSDNCPAYTTGKKLSPKHFTLALRDHLYDLEPHYLDMGGVEAPAKNIDTKAEQKGWPEGYHHTKKVTDLIGDVIHPEVIWACTTCRACEEQCPVNISYVDKIVEMRRHEMMIKNEFPHELQKAFQAMEVNGNPWNLPASDRGNWTSGLEVAGKPIQVPLLSEHQDAEIVYWVGCAAEYDDDAKKTARAVAKLLHHAGVDYAIMGSDATCTGDPARRAGNEYLFQMLAQQNVEALNGAGAAKKTIVTACPHCFNTLANEYPSFGGKYNVVHHSELLASLLAQGKLRPTKRVDATVAYHDSCYLGRYNGIYDSPRQIIASIPGVRIVEAEYWNKERGLCCGAGGAQMWKEEEPGKTRVNTKRTLQLVETGADTIASGCPFCKTMIVDGLKAVEREESVKPLDLAVLLEQAIDFGASSGGHDDEDEEEGDEVADAAE